MDFEDELSFTAASTARTTSSSNTKRRKKRVPLKDVIPVVSRPTTTSTPTVTSHRPSSSSSSSSSGVRRHRPIQKSQLQRKRRKEVSDNRSTTTNPSRPSTTSANSSASASASSASVASSSSAKISVRGGGVSAWAVQDAGTNRVLHDECLYLCSTILACKGGGGGGSSGGGQSIEAAIDLATMLSSAKTRSVLYQRQRDNQNQDLLRDNEEPTTMKVIKTEEVQTTSPVLNSILDVLAKVPTRATTKRKKNRQGIDDASSTVAAMKKGRTKSSRRKVKQEMKNAALQQSSAGAGDNDMTLSIEMRQVLSAIVYFLSWDCTLSEDHSVAVLGAKTRCASVARRIRSSILHHKGALHGILHLTSSLQNDQKNPRPTEQIQLLVPPPPVPPPPTSPSNVSSVSDVSGIKQSGTPTDNRGVLRTAKRFGARGTRTYGSSGDSLLYVGGGLHGGSGVDDDGISSLSSQTIPGGAPTAGAAFHGRGGGVGGDPTAAGRRNRRLRRHRVEHDNLEWQSQIIPPATASAPTDTKVQNSESENLSFDSEQKQFVAPLSPPPPRKRPPPQLPGGNDGGGVGGGGVTSTTSGPPSVTSSQSSSLMNYLSPATAEKLKRLLEKVSAGKPSSSAANAYSSCVHEVSLYDSSPWTSMVCLQSLTRIITGKEQNGPSCLEDQESSSENDPEDELNNPILATNNLLGDSGIVPLLGKIMSESLNAVHDLVVSTTSLDKMGDDNDEEESISHDCLSYWYDRISLLASMIDGACLFNTRNRRSFCENDPFSFDQLHEDEIVDDNDTNVGLLYTIYKFLRLCSYYLRTRNESMNGIMLLSLRTLTSLTHDNDIAAQQTMKRIKNTAMTYHGNNDTSTICGLEILAQLVYDIEEYSNNDNDEKKIYCDTKKNIHMDNKNNMKNNNDDDLHRYDSTIFCLNTLANVCDAIDARNVVSKIHVTVMTTPVAVAATSATTKKGNSTITTATAKNSSILWVKWLCHWLVSKTTSFHDEILRPIQQSNSVNGKGTNKKNNDHKNKNRNGNTNHHSPRELHTSEEDRLLAAGNGCVLLACLMKGPDDDEDADDADDNNYDFSAHDKDGQEQKKQLNYLLREMIINEMPKNKDGTTAGFIMIINTMKAFCNFYRFSLGELSVAVVTPVRKLISSLEDIQQNYYHQVLVQRKQQQEQQQLRLRHQKQHGDAGTSSSSSSGSAGTRSSRRRRQQQK